MRNTNDARLKPVLNITTGKTYHSVTEAAADLGTSSSTLSLVLNGKKNGYKRNQLCFIADMSANAEKIANEISDNAWIADMNYKANKALEKQLKEAEAKAEAYRIKAEAYDKLMQRQAELKARKHELEEKRKAIDNEMKIIDSELM